MGWPDYMRRIADLRCPDTMQTLMIANAPALRAVNDAVEQGVCINIGGEKVTEKLTDALIREDQERLYPVRNGVPILLIEEGIGIKPRV